MSQATRMFLGALATFALATTGCESKSKDGVEAQAKAQMGQATRTNFQSNSDDPMLRLTLEGGDLEAPIVFEKHTGVIAVDSGRTVMFGNLGNKGVPSKDGKHQLLSFNCGGGLKSEAGKPEPNLGFNCNFKINSQLSPLGEKDQDWQAQVSRDPQKTTLEIIAYNDKAKHFKVDSQASAVSFKGQTPNPKTFKLHAEFKIIKF